MRTLLALLLASCSAMAVDEIQILTSCALGIWEPGKIVLRVEDPIILTPASDFDVKYLSNRVEIRRNPQLMRWADPTWDKPDLRWMTETKTNWVRLENQWREVGLIVEETTTRSALNCFGLMTTALRMR